MSELGMDSNNPLKTSTEPSIVNNKFHLGSINEQNSICTQEDLKDFNSKFINRNKFGCSQNESKEESIDPSLIIFGSVNQTVDKPSSKTSTVRDLKQV